MSSDSGGDHDGGPSVSTSSLGFPQLLVLRRPAVPPDQPTVNSTRASTLDTRRPGRDRDGSRVDRCSVDGGGARLSAIHGVVYGGLGLVCRDAKAGHHKGPLSDGTSMIKESRVMTGSMTAGPSSFWGAAEVRVAGSVAHQLRASPNREAFGMPPVGQRWSCQARREPIPAHCCGAVACGGTRHQASTKALARALVAKVCRGRTSSSRIERAGSERFTKVHQGEGVRGRAHVRGVPTSCAVPDGHALITRNIAPQQKGARRLSTGRPMSRAACAAWSRVLPTKRHGWLSNGQPRCVRLAPRLEMRPLRPRRKIRDWPRSDDAGARAPRRRSTRLHRLAAARGCARSRHRSGPRARRPTAP